MIGKAREGTGCRAQTWRWLGGRGVCLRVRVRMVTGPFVSFCLHLSWCFAFNRDGWNAWMKEDAGWMEKEG